MSTTNSTMPDLQNGSNQGPELDPGVANVLKAVAGHLEAGQTGQALLELRRTRSESAWLKNAQGVCFLRGGDVPGAIEVFRGLVMASGGLTLRQDVPTVFKTNFALALLASGNLTGFFNAFGEIKERDHPAVVRIRDFMARWKGNMSLLQKLLLFLGNEPSRPPQLDFAAGDLI